MLEKHLFKFQAYIEQTIIIIVNNDNTINDTNIVII